MPRESKSITGFQRNAYTGDCEQFEGAIYHRTGVTCSVKTTKEQVIISTQSYADWCLAKSVAKQLTIKEVVRGL